MAKKIVPLSMSAQTLSTLKMRPQIEHPRTGVKRCQTQALSAQNLFKGLIHLPSRESQPPLLLRDALVPIPGPVLVVAQHS